MLKRQYFFSVKVAHNDNSGEYSWWHSSLTTKSWRIDADILMSELREVAVEKLQPRLEREITEKDIEILAFNRV